MDRHVMPNPIDTGIEPTVTLPHATRWGRLGGRVGHQHDSELDLTTRLLLLLLLLESWKSGKVEKWNLSTVDAPDHPHLDSRWSMTGVTIAVPFGVILMLFVKTTPVTHYPLQYCTEHRH